MRGRVERVRQSGVLDNARLTRICLVIKGSHKSYGFQVSLWISMMSNTRSLGFQGYAMDFK